MSTGGGSNETQEVTELFNSERVSIVTSTKDIEGKEIKKPKLSRQYLSTREHLRPTIRLPLTIEDSLVDMISELVKDNGLNKVRIFTDGSYTEHNNPLQTTLESPDLLKPTATAGPVITDDSPNWKQRPVISIHFAQDDNVKATSVFHMECLALILALTLTEKSLNCTGTHIDS